MKLNYIDSARGIAIIMVITVHVSHHVHGLGTPLFILSNYCQLGVQLFFVASAYTLCNSTVNRDQEKNKWTNYFIRRIFRIGPLYYIGILVYFLSSILFTYLDTQEFIIAEKYSFGNVLANISLLHGLYPPANNNIVPGGWSIGTEMLFYFLFPFIFVMFQKYSGENHLRKTMFFLGAILFIVFLNGCVIFINGIEMKNNSFIYYSILNQLPVFLMGMVLYFNFEKLSSVFSQRTSLLICFMVTTVSLLVWYLAPPLSFLFIPLISAISFSFLLLGIRQLSFPIAERVGRLSFSIYIYHFIVIELIYWFFTTYGDIRLHPYISLIAFVLLTAFLTYFIAFYSEKYLEKTFIRLGNRLIEKMTKK